MSYGYTGNILRVDLTTKKHWTEHPPKTFYRTYWGGRALSLYYMLKEMKAKTDPLSPDNLLIFAPSVITAIPSVLNHLSLGHKENPKREVGGVQN